MKNLPRSKGEPEERVRRALLAHLASLGVPSACTRAEFPLSSVDSSVKDRADVVVFQAVGSRMEPVLLAECKAPEVPISESVFAQVRRYQRLLPAPWIVVTNGRVLRSWNLRDGAWREEALPRWEEMKGRSPRGGMELSSALGMDAG